MAYQTEERPAVKNIVGACNISGHAHRDRPLASRGNVVDPRSNIFDLHIYRRRLADMDGSEIGADIVVPA